MRRMRGITPDMNHGLKRQARRRRAQVVAWWHTLQMGAQITVLMLSPRSYTGGRARTVLSHQVAAVLPLLPWFTVLSALISLVIIRIVTATASSYGLSQYALEVLVRTLVLELIPLFAALFVALRHAMPGAEQLRHQLDVRQRAGGHIPGIAGLAGTLLPRAMASMHAVVLLAALAGVVALVITYLVVHGLSPWAVPSYTYDVGRVFNSVVSLIFLLKTLFFSLAVATVPLAGAAEPDEHGRYVPRSDMVEFARLFSVLLMVEMAALVGNYY
ncbi:MULTISPECIES: MlaE family ABC transporter permease [Hydrogenophaga]|jgi:phospholipid/cholesterol/gamma-HCH transport system permease protein|uniref:ABC-type transport system permease n=1 Tax=Hydrogenophaga intermedia TaxID=65786 RepID=A0A1L1PZD6_HYDIT|nr:MULTISPECIES: ABC transporter permease [Hydrogenophaga]CDN90605.1 ABC-type transport system permease [Hydrogenophaga intermedia]